MKHFLLGLFLLSALSVSAQNQYFVAATGGSDSNVGTSAVSPWATCNHAILTANQAGGSVINFIASSSNHAACTINRSGTSQTVRMVLKCTAPLTAATHCKMAGHFSVTSGNNVDIGALPQFGFEYTNPSDDVAVDLNTPCATDSGACSSGNSIHVLGNYFHDIALTLGCVSAGAILMTNAHGVSVTDTQVIGNIIDHYGSPAGGCNQAQGIYIATQNGKVYDNIVMRSGYAGLQYYDQGCGARISNNIFVGNFGVGIVLYGSRGCTAGLNTVSNNVVANNTGQAFNNSFGSDAGCTAGRQTLYSNNIVFGNGSNGFTHALSSCTTVQSQLSENPTTTFVDYTGTASGDYHLKAGSIAIGGGTPNCTPGGFTPCTPPADLAGASFGSPRDIGVFASGGGGGGTPVSNVSPGTLPFGSATAGVDCTTAIPSTSTYSNTGSGSLTIASETITGTNSADFPFGGVGTCSVGQTLTGGQTCTVSAKFCPAISAIGARSAQINITSNATAQAVSLTGTATAPLTPILTTPSPLAFGNQNINTTSSPLNYHIANSGTGPLSVTGLVVAGNFATSGTGTCGPVPFSVAAGAFCDQPITFTPLSLGSLSGTVTLTHNAAGSPTTTNLSGTGTQPNATLTSTLSFGTVALSTASTSQPAILTNTGNGPLIVTAVTISAPFSQTNSCGALPFTLAPSATCTFNVVCTPNVTGVINGQLQTTDNAPSPTQISALSCTGGTPTSNGLTIKGGVLITGGVRLLPHP